MDTEEYKMKISRDWKAVIDYARMEGKTIGKIESAKELIINGVAIEIIIKATGLTEEQINNL